MTSIPGELGSANRLAAVTPSNSTPLADGCRGIYVGGAGDVAIKAEQDSAAVTFVGVPAGTILPIRALYVMSTNATATSIVALF